MFFKEEGMVMLVNTPDPEGLCTSGVMPSYCLLQVFTGKDILFNSITSFWDLH